MLPRAALLRLTAPAKRMGFGERFVRRSPLWYPRARGLFERLDGAGLEERRAWTARQLASALRLAAGTPYGRRVGGTSDLATWPLLEPAIVRGAPREVAREARWALPASTGGTTGVPLPLWRSWRSVAVEQAALDHLLSRHGVDPVRAKVAILRGDDVKPLSDREPPFWIDVEGGRRRIFSSNHLTRATLSAYADALREPSADYWWVYPTTLESLLGLLGEARTTLRVPLVLSSSEVLAPPLRDRAREALGAAVVDHYGQAERVAFAWAGPDGAYRFLPGYAHVELIPLPDAEGRARYEIVGTGLWNECMPLVRYRTGDLIESATPLTEERREAIALGLEPFAGVIGRDGDILIAPDGARLTGIDHFHRGVDRVMRIQVVHETPARVIVRVLPAPGFGEAERALLLEHARRKLPPSMSVEVVVADALERTALGKTPFVVRRPGVPGPGDAR